jgi:hypothetical protein
MRTKFAEGSKPRCRFSAQSALRPVRRVAPRARARPLSAEHKVWPHSWPYLSIAIAQESSSDILSLYQHTEHKFYQK